MADTHLGGETYHTAWPLSRAWKALTVRLGTDLEAESGTLFLWSPVLLGAGIAFYFALPFEPGVLFPAGLFLAAAGAVVFMRNQPAGFHFTVVIALVCAGFSAAAMRTAGVVSPVVAKRLGPVGVEGVVEKLERRSGGSLRVRLKVLSVERLTTEKTPRTLQLTIRGSGVAISPGDRIAARAILFPLPEPVRPGGFDYARQIWFQGIGGVGRIVSSPRVLPQEGAGKGWRTAIERLRQGVGRRINEALPGPAGGIATALITGERGGIPKDIVQHLRAAGLAHVLAISGMHMAIFAGSLFWLVRALLATVPVLALAYPIKKWAAGAALFGAAFYLALSGSGIATQRAFVMIAIMFTAIMLDRPAISLRNVALAALAILIARPESLLNVSFQMSFAAVTALVAFYEAIRRHVPRRRGSAWGKSRLVLYYLGGIALTTLIASLATAPFAAYHFHRVAQFGLLGNIAAMPLVGLLVMPAALATLLVMPLGLEAWPLQIMALGIDGVTVAAAWVSALPGAVVPVPDLSAGAFALVVVGGLWLCLWRTRRRLAGLAIMGLAALPGWAGAPDILVERGGKAVAVRGPEGKLWISQARGGRYSVDKWLRADGDRRRPKEAVDKGGLFTCDNSGCVARSGERLVSVVHHASALDEECRTAGILITTLIARRECSGPDIVIDRLDLWAKGAHAITFRNGRAYLRTASDARGNRPWTVTRHLRRKSR